MSQSPPRLQWLDTPDRYGIVTRVLHWGMALVFLWQFTGMILRLILGRTPLMAFWVGTHPPVGMVLLILIAARLIWAWHNRHRRPPHGTDRLGRLARLGQGALYALMLIIPSLGLLRLYGSERGFALFGRQIFAPRAEKVAWMSAPADALHSPLAWTLLALIVGHVAMALAHHFRWRDGVLQRMTGKRRR
ncbi:MAG: cytochrome b [Paracoccaceae bacterium]